MGVLDVVLKHPWSTFGRIDGTATDRRRRILCYLHRRKAKYIQQPEKACNKAGSCAEQACRRVDPAAGGCDVRLPTNRAAEWGHKGGKCCQDAARCVLRNEIIGGHGHCCSARLRIRPGGRDVAYSHHVLAT